MRIEKYEIEKSSFRTDWGVAARRGEERFLTWRCWANGEEKREKETQLGVWDSRGFI